MKGLCLVFFHCGLLTHKFPMRENLPHAPALARETLTPFCPVSGVLSACGEESCKCFEVGALESTLFLDSTGHAGQQLKGLIQLPNLVGTKLRAYQGCGKMI